VEAVGIIGALLAVAVVLVVIWAWVMGRLDERRDRREAGPAAY
jgi:hypothetical protein